MLFNKLLHDSGLFRPLSSGLFSESLHFLLSDCVFFFGRHRFLHWLHWWLLQFPSSLDACPSTFLRKCVRIDCRRRTSLPLSCAASAGTHSFFLTTHTHAHKKKNE